MKKEYLIGPIFLIIVWYLVYFLELIPRIFIPLPHILFIDSIKLLTQSYVWVDIINTAWRTIISFIVAGLIGIPIGLLMGYYSKIYKAFEIMVDFSRSLPALAVFPLAMFFFGIGDSAKIATAIFSCSFIIAINSVYGVTGVIHTRKIVAQLMGAKTHEIFFKVVLPDALPSIMIGLRTSLSLAVIVIVATEMFIGNIGIGNRIYEAQLTFRVTEMYSYIIFAGLLGYFLNKGFVFLEKKIVHWSGK